jgi:hypothetical protein
MGANWASTSAIFALSILVQSITACATDLVCAHDPTHVSVMVAAQLATITAAQIL